MIKKYDSWLNESESFAVERAVDIVLYYCLQALHPQGGNDVGLIDHMEADWKTINPNIENPDLWVNTELSQCEKELKIVLDKKSFDWNLIKRKFDECLLYIETLKIDEAIIHIKLPSFPNYNLDSKEEIQKAIDTVVKFYTEIRPNKMKEIEEKWKTYFNSKKFGL